MIAATHSQGKGEIQEPVGGGGGKERGKVGGRKGERKEGREGENEGEKGRFDLCHEL